MPSPITLTPFPAPPLITIAPSPPPHPDPVREALWRSLRAANPRLHDGPILLVQATDPSTGRLICTRATYKSLATAPVRSLRALGVQGVVIARDTAGEEHLLLGRRSAETRIYRGLWENAPSGSMPAPPPHQAQLTRTDFTTALRQEGIEELGLDLANSDIRWLATLDDPDAQSLDIVLEVRPRASINPRAAPCPTRDSRWEYSDTAWIALADLRAWSARHLHALSPPTLALIHHLFT